MLEVSLLQVTGLLHVVLAKVYAAVRLPRGMGFVCAICMGLFKYPKSLSRSVALVALATFHFASMPCPQSVKFQIWSETS